MPTRPTISVELDHDAQTLGNASQRIRPSPRPKALPATKRAAFHRGPAHNRETGQFFHNQHVRAHRVSRDFSYTHFELLNWPCFYLSSIRPVWPRSHFSGCTRSASGRRSADCIGTALGLAPFLFPGAAIYGFWIATLLSPRPHDGLQANTIVFNFNLHPRCALVGESYAVWDLYGNEPGTVFDNRLVKTIRCGVSAIPPLGRGAGDLEPFYFVPIQCVSALLPPDWLLHHADLGGS